MRDKPPYYDTLRDRLNRLLLATGMSRSSVARAIGRKPKKPGKPDCIVCQGTGLHPRRLCRTCEGAGTLLHANRGNWIPPPETNEVKRLKLSVKKEQAEFAIRQMEKKLSEAKAELETIKTELAAAGGEIPPAAVKPE